MSIDPIRREPGRVGRRFLLLVLKLGLLTAAAWVVSRQVSWNDRLTLRDGAVLEGRILDPQDADDGVVAFRTRAGETVRVRGEDVAEGGRVFGLRTTFRNLHPGWFALGMTLIFFMYVLGVTRWRILLEAQGITASWGRAFRLTFMGFFWNNFMPGMTGGDVAKAVLIAKESPGMRSRAVSTVIVDRVIGLAVLAGLSAGAILINFETFQKQGYVIFGVLAILLVAACCVLSRRARRFLRIDRILKALPGSGILMQLDEAFRLYRTKPKAVLWAVVLSLVAHLCNIGSVWVYGQDLGIPASLLTYFATVPIILIAASVPLFPGGWGVREVAFITAFQAVGVPAAYRSELVLLSVLLGISVMIWSLLGGVFLFVGSSAAPAELKTSAVSAGSLDRKELES